MQRDHDDDAWRAIVENYGERAELDDEPEPPSPTAAPAATFFELAPAPVEPQEPRELRDAWDDSAEDEERFVPPPPPPLPKLPPDRLAAWSGLVGAPAVLMLFLVTGLRMPDWGGYLLVAAFIGGFAYLVVTMKAGPDDPWDDGARL
ncbi:hypothetical protein [Nocardioides flavescens]|uniref:DUF308 domain-containing protein n=1 Tax=Nocardioides flavescens TaxID=2691959 RepID=A0A6L7ETY1_9ACTN|nr:hypothetical protein [Nocardioides flavescens]MXG90793.1 hypothetical protein [Nocardioides flavescens]